MRPLISAKIRVAQPGLARGHRLGVGVLGLQVGDRLRVVLVGEPGVVVDDRVAVVACARRGIRRATGGTGGPPEGWPGGVAAIAVEASARVGFHLDSDSFLPNVPLRLRPLDPPVRGCTHTCSSQNLLLAKLPGYCWFCRLIKQLAGVNPFQGDIRPSRVPLLWGCWKRPSLPFPHPWNYDQPIRILETYFWEADQEEGPGRHNRYLDVPGFAPVLVSRDPRVIRAITAETGDREGQFDRDTLPSVGIARATGPDTLLFANGPIWRMQKKLSAPPFGKTTLFQPEQFQEFESHISTHRVATPRCPGTTTGTCPAAGADPARAGNQSRHAGDAGQ